MRYVLLSLLIACGCAKPVDSARLATLTTRISGLTETVASADHRITENTRALNYIRDVVDGLPDNGQEYQTTSLAVEGLDLEYFEAKFATLEAAIEAAIEAAACDCEEPVTAPKVSSQVPELFEPPKITPVAADRVVSSRIVSVGQPKVVSVGQPVTTYSSPLRYSYSQPVRYSSGVTNTSGMTMSCQNGVCQTVQRPNGTRRTRLRIKR